MEGDGITSYFFEQGGAIAPDGTVYVANAAYTQDYHGEADLMLWRSPDGGVTWDSHKVATSNEPADCPWADGCYFGFFGAQAAVAADDDGKVLFVWAANSTAGAPHALYAASSPGGADWDAFGDPVALTDGTGEANFPAVTAAPGPGDFRIAWQGNVAGNNATWNTWYQRSIDGGATWLADPVKLSDRGDGADYKHAEGYNFPYGDFFGLSVDGDGVTHVIWAEGASWTGPGGTWWTSGL